MLSKRGSHDCFRVEAKTRGHDGSRGALCRGRGLHQRCGSSNTGKARRRQSVALLRRSEISDVVGPVDLSKRQLARVNASGRAGLPTIKKTSVEFIDANDCSRKMRLVKR